MDTTKVVRLEDVFAKLIELDVISETLLLLALEEIKEVKESN